MNYIELDGPIGNNVFLHNRLLGDQDSISIPKIISRVADNLEVRYTDPVVWNTEIRYNAIITVYKCDNGQDEPIVTFSTRSAFEVWLAANNGKLVTYYERSKGAVGGPATTAVAKVGILMIQDMVERKSAYQYNLSLIQTL